MLLVGSSESMELNAAQVEQRFNQPLVAASLAEVGVASPAALIATWVTDRDGLERYADGARPVTDDWPSIEYATWVHRNEFGRVLPAVLALQIAPPLTDASVDFVADVKAQHEILMRFYESGLAAYRGDRDGWSRSLKAALSADPDNPYFRWVAGGE